MRGERARRALGNISPESPNGGLRVAGRDVTGVSEQPGHASLNLPFHNPLCFLNYDVTTRLSSERGSMVFGSPRVSSDGRKGGNIFMFMVGIFFRKNNSSDEYDYLLVQLV